MGAKRRLSRSVSGLLVSLGLLSLVFLGSPGCGCGSDSLGPPLEERPDRCCCDFEWLPPSNVFDRDVVISVENMDTSLDAGVTPSLLVGVSGRQVEQFTVCVNDEHLPGDTLELVFTDQVTLVEYGRAMLIYSVRCTPEIEPLSPEMNLASTDCGGETLLCCCEFEWLPAWQDGELIDVTIVAENASPGLNPVIAPTAITDVAEGVIELIDVCVDANHPLGAQMDLVVKEDPSGFVVGVVELVYNEPCVPTVVPITKAPTLDITSTECGGESLFCCCDFEWLPGPNMTGDVLLQAINVSDGLTVQINPSTLTGVDPRVFENFTICINNSHDPLDSFDLLITSTSGPELGRARITYRMHCTPDIGDVPDFGSLALTSTDCGGDPITCCCDFEWIAPTAWNPPPGPWTATLENVDPSLQTATITPSSIDVSLGIPSIILFTVCVNPTHDTSTTMDVVLRSQTGVEFSRLNLYYLDLCEPMTLDISGEGSWINLCEPD